jgi:hypothetical protein
MQRSGWERCLRAAGHDADPAHHRGVALGGSDPAWLAHFRNLNRGAGLLVDGMGLKLLAGTVIEWRDGGT